MDDLIFVTAQPDVPYFHWQIRLYVHNFISKGINPKNIHVIFSIPEQEKEPSDESIELLKLGIQIHFFNDDRDNKHYIPSIKPYLISKWIQKNPKYGELFFLHDADIIFNKLPSFDRLLNDEVCYLSDTIGYIGYDYLKNCSKNYETKFENCGNEELIDLMCDVIGIDKEVIIKNQNNSGGGQYLIKNTNYEVWEKIYKNSNEMHSTLIKFQRKYPINTGQIQFWTSEMWSLLWNLWLINKETKITPELDFSWATDTIEIYEKKPILHMAGVTENLKHNKFYKGDFIEKNPIEFLQKDPKYFDYIEKTSSTVKYIDNMKDYIKKLGNRLFI
jgi:hypothetical protein